MGHARHYHQYWNKNHKPAAATVATVTQAGVSNKRHVLKSIIGTIACGATAQTPIFIDVLSGSDVIHSIAVAAPANGQGGIAINDLDISAAKGEDLTVAFSAAGVADSRQAMAIVGHTENC